MPENAESSSLESRMASRTSYVINPTSRTSSTTPPPDTIAYQTVHTYYTYVLKHDDNPPHGGTGPIDRDGYNVYAVEILPDSLVFSINGQKTFTYPRIETKEKGQYPFGTPFYLLVDMQIEGSWVGRARPEELPVEMWVDWVKVYKLRD